MLIDDFAAILRSSGISHGAGVPCSYFTPLVNHMTASPDMDYVGAASEGEAVAIAAGMTAAGKPAFALMQNSGLGNAVNPITSLLHIYRIPVTLLVSHRGQPGVPDEPQHQLMGEITERLAQLCGLRTHVFDADRFDELLPVVRQDAIPSAFIFRKGSLSGGPSLRTAPLTVEVGAVAQGPAGALKARVTRAEALLSLLPLLGEPDGDGQPAHCPAVVSTTGKLSRELYELDDTDHSRSNRFYMVGSMGCASGFGLGVALAQPARPVIVLDGDGALLMKLGSLATIGARQPKNFHHVVFDNGAHDSTGGQPTASGNVDFQVLASACGYREVRTVDSEDAAHDALQQQLASPGPTLLRVLVTTGARKDLGRPTLSPKDAYLRFSDFLALGVEL